MKRKILYKFLSLTFVVATTAFLVPNSFANMAEPSYTDLASSVTLEKNDDIAVISEVIDIKINEDKANINAKYKMKNMKDVDVSTKSMFISPNVINTPQEITFNNKNLVYSCESYYLNYDTEVLNDGWKYKLDKVPECELQKDRKVDTITFDLDFKANEEAYVNINYDYHLGGYPLVPGNEKYASLKYYLTPANLWNNFENLEINLYTQKDLPLIAESNLEFVEVEKRHYQYKSNTLPNVDLEIILDQTGWQNFVTFFKSKHFGMTMAMFAPVYVPVIILIIIIVTCVLVHKHKKKKRLKNE